MWVVVHTVRELFTCIYSRYGCSREITLLKNTKKLLAIFKPIVTVEEQINLLKYLERSN
jgi:hypothetical protein